MTVGSTTASQQEGCRFESQPEVLGVVTFMGFSKLQIDKTEISLFDFPELNLKDFWSALHFSATYYIKLSNKCLFFSVILKQDNPKFSNIKHI